MGAWPWGVAGAWPRASPARAVRQSARPPTCSPPHPRCREGPPSACPRGPEPHGPQSSRGQRAQGPGADLSPSGRAEAFRAGREQPQQHETSKRHRQARSSRVKGHTHPLGKILLLLSGCPAAGRQKLHWPFRRTRRRPLSCLLPSRRIGICDFCFLFFSMKNSWCGKPSRVKAVEMARAAR